MSSKLTDCSLHLSNIVRICVHKTLHRCVCCWDTKSSSAAEADDPESPPGSPSGGPGSSEDFDGIAKSRKAMHKPFVLMFIFITSSSLIPRPDSLISQPDSMVPGPDYLVPRPDSLVIFELILCLRLADSLLTIS